MGVLAWFIRRELNKNDQNVRDGKNERHELRDTVSAVEREVHQRIDKMERDAERDYVKREDLQLLLGPINTSLAQIHNDLKEAAAVPQILTQHSEQIQAAIGELKALREDYQKGQERFWKEFSGALTWAKRKSEAE